jgi:hypothetical protein
MSLNETNIYSNPFLESLFFPQKTTIETRIYKKVSFKEGILELWNDLEQ